MKALLSYLAVAALFIASSFTVNKQHQLNQQTVNSCFTRFNAHRAGKASIQLTWNVSAADITDFVVERSYDGDFFETVTTVSFDGSASYKSKDDVPYPGIIYYRITAEKSDGSSECSSVESVRIVQRR